MKLFALAAVAVLLLPVRGSAQSALAPSTTAVSVSGTYAGAVARSSGRSLDGLGARGASLDATYGRVTVGGALAFYRYETTVDLSAGFHVVRRHEEHLATTLGLSLQFVEGTEVVVPSISHARRIAGTPGLAVVPSATVGLAITSQRDVGLAALAAGGVSFMVGQGQTRAVVTPSLAWTRGADDVVSMGVSAGVVQSFGRR